MNSKQLADNITDLIFNKKGFDVKILDLRELTAMADYFVICSADSDTQVKAIADEIDKSLRDDGIRAWHKEGYKGLNWVLLDYVDVVAHIFKKDVRSYYNLERLWGDAPSIEVEDPALSAAESKKIKVSKSRKINSSKQ